MLNVASRCQPVIAVGCSVLIPTVNEPQTVPFYSTCQHEERLQQDSNVRHRSPLCPLLVEYAMSTLLAPDCVAFSQAHFVIAFAADVLHLRACGALASLNTI